MAQTKIGKLNFLKPETLQVLIDCFTLTISFLFFFYFRFESGIIDKNIYYTLNDVIVINVIVVAFWIILFWSAGLYGNMYIVSPFEEIWTIVKFCLLGILLIYFLVLIDSTRVPRMQIVVYFVINTVAMIVGRLLSRYIQKQLRRKRLISFPTLVIGNSKESHKVMRMLELSPSWGFNPSGYIPTTEQGNKDMAYSCLGEIDDIRNILINNKIQKVILVDETQNPDLLMQIVNVCSHLKVKVSIVSSLYDIFTGRVRTYSMFGIPFIEVDTRILKPWEAFVKRLMDICFSLCVIVIGIPFWLIIGAIIKLESRGPVFYIQNRVGKDGKDFKIYKFRSMVDNAQKLGGIWTSVNDKRVTKFGKFIRKSHIDEMPQFWNVLIGDMSIVGPRPEQRIIVDKYLKILPIYERRLIIRPGITGWWQIQYGQYEENLEEIKGRLKDDFFYIENMSVKLDIEIIFRTVFIMLKGHGQA